MILLFSALALAHGGEDHDTPASPTAGPTETVRSDARSERLEAVLRTEAAEPGTPVGVTLLLADFATSAPMEGATVRLDLAGPGTVGMDLSAVAPGIYTTIATFPAAGDYAGPLVVTTPTRSDLLAMSVHVHEAASAPGSGPQWVGAACLAIGLAAGFGALAGGLGYALGRRRGLAAAAALAVTAAGQQVLAHGGEDHGAPASAAAPAGGAIALPLESQFLLGLRTLPAARQAFRDQIQSLGTFVARPGERATLRAPVAGILLAPPQGFPTPGDRVQAGDLLAQIRAAASPELGQARSEASTRVAELEAALTLAERDAAQAAALGPAISERERLERQQAVTVAREALRQARGARSAAGGTLAVRAPLGGTLGPTTARPGDQVEVGTPLFRISDVVGLWLEARVPERLAVGIAPGATAQVTTPADPERRLAATVLDAGQETDPATGTVLVTLSVEGDDLDIRPGSGARAWIGRGAERDALVIPDGAVVDSNGVTLAFVKTGPEQFEARELRLGGRGGGEVEVLSGIAAGERIVVEGTYALRSLAGR